MTTAVCSRYVSSMEAKKTVTSPCCGHLRWGGGKVNRISDSSPAESLSSSLKLGICVFGALFQLCAAKKRLFLLSTCFRAIIQDRIEYLFVICCFIFYFRDSGSHNTEVSLMSAGALSE